MVALLVIIYITFISLGLPDSLLGSAWPVMNVDLGAPLSMAGYITMAICMGTIVSSLMSSRLISRFGTGKVTVVSVALTALALFGFSNSPNVQMLFALAVPLGLGAGSIDSALNNFVALHYKAMHMSWLHCFWGIGATSGPVIMSIFILQKSGWRTGYLTISIIQAVLLVLLLVTLPLWKQNSKSNAGSAEPSKKVSNREALKIPFVKLALVAFIFFCATETTTGLWSSSYLVAQKGLSAAKAAQWVAYFYAGITVGRLLAGFLTIKLKSHQLIRAGQIICVIGAVVLMLPLPVFFSMIGITLIGFGTAPIFPAMLHETPNRFGTSASGAIMGLQMAFAYIGSTLFPPLFGAIASATTIKLFPWFLLCCILVMLFASELLQKKIKKS